MFKFRLQNYNEFRNHVSWHDYFTIMVNEFAVILVRRYDWLETEEYTFVVTVMGFDVFRRVGSY